MICPSCRVSGGPWTAERVTVDYRTEYYRLTDGGWVAEPIEDELCPCEDTYICGNCHKRTVAGMLDAPHLPSA